MSAVDSCGYYKFNCCNGHFSPYNKGKKSEMWGSSEMKKSIKKLKHLETTINQSTLYSGKIVDKDRMELSKNISLINFEVVI